MFKSFGARKLVRYILYIKSLWMPPCHTHCFIKPEVGKKTMPPVSKKSGHSKSKSFLIVLTFTFATLYFIKKNHIFLYAIHVWKSTFHQSIWFEKCFYLPSKIFNIMAFVWNAKPYIYKKVFVRNVNVNILIFISSSTYKQAAMVKSVIVIRLQSKTKIP